MRRGFDLPPAAEQVEATFGVGIGIGVGFDVGNEQK